MTNPTSTSPPPPPPSAADEVSGPAIGLMVTAVLGGLVAVTGVAANLLGIGLSAVPGLEQEDRISTIIGGTIGLALGTVGIVIAVVTFVGARRMQQLRSRGLALTVSVLAMMPCVSPCCLIGLPIGIWSLIVLNKPEVRGAFGR